MKTNPVWSRTCFIAGVVAYLVGTLDPMEGSVLILAGCGLIALSTFLRTDSKAVRAYWLWVLGLVAVGVAILWGFSFIGGFGGTTGRSMWWALTILPYPVGWLMAFAGLLLRLVRFVASNSRKRAHGVGTTT